MGNCSLQIETMHQSKLVEIKTSRVAYCGDKFEYVKIVSSERIKTNESATGLPLLPTRPTS